MAPAAQKGKKASPAAKNAKKEESVQKQQQVEEVVMEEAEEQTQEEERGEEEKGEAAAAAGGEYGDKEAATGGEDDDEEAAAAEEETEEEVADDEEAAAAEEETEEEESVAVEEVVAEDIEEAVDIDEEEEVEGAEKKAHGDRPGEEDVLMQNGHVASHGDGTKVTVAAAKDSSDDNASPSGGKIFIGGLTRETTTEMLTGHFKKYGEITDFVIMKNRSTGHPRGFGFVTFSDPSVVDTVLQDTHVLDGRTVEAKRTVPREKMSGPSKGPKTKKIFVGGLTTSTTEEELKNYFEKFGKIAEYQIMQDHGTGRSRGFGFVTFESEQVVEEILAQGKMHELDGKQVEIKKAEPKRANEPPSSHDRGGHFGGRGGGGYNANTGFYEALNGGDAPGYGAAGGYYNRGEGRPGGYPYGGAYVYGGGYGGSYGYGDVDDGYSGMAYNYAGYGSGSAYGYNYGGGSYGGSRGYGNGRYHPYNR